MTVPPVQWFVLDVNPYPWKVPPVSVGRKGSRMFPTFGRDEGLFVYKEAIREQLEAQGPVMIEGPVALYLWFYRHLQEYTSRQHAARKQRAHEADNTNLQKSTEDALQGYLYANDKDVAYNVSYRVEQSIEAQPLVVACVMPFDPQPPVFPDTVQSMIDEVRNRYPLASNSFNSEGEVPF